MLEFFEHLRRFTIGNTPERQRNDGVTLAVAFMDNLRRLDGVQLVERQIVYENKKHFLLIGAEQASVAKDVEIERLLVCIELCSEMILELLDELLSVHTLTGSLRSNETEISHGRVSWQTRRGFLASGALASSSSMRRHSS